MAYGIKTGGRQAGTPNKLTKELRVVLKNVLYQELENLPDYFSKLEMKDRVELMVKLMPFALPKVNNIYFGVGEAEKSFMDSD